MTAFRRVLAGALAAGMVSVSACSSGAQSDSLVVNALWVSTGEDSTSAGTSPVTVTLKRSSRSSDVAPFSVDLTNEEAQGAGSQWLAASANAATTGTLLSGSDPNGVEVGFEIESAIDGASAGGLLGVGVIALQRGVSLNEGITMTGTLNPDGSIGTVSGIAAKIRAAASEGYEKVLIPAGTTEVADSETSSAVDPVQLGETVGVEVERVATVDHAYGVLTGQSLLRAGQPTPQIDASVVSGVESRAERLRADLRRKVRNSRDSTGAAEAQKCLTKGSNSLKSGEVVTAYSTLWLCLRTLESKVAATVAELSSKNESTSTVQTRLANRSKLGSSAAQALTSAPVDSEKLTAAGFVGWASAKSWPFWAQAGLATFNEDLSGGSSKSAATLASYAAAISEADFNVTHTYPNTAYVLEHWPAAKVKLGSAGTDSVGGESSSRGSNESARTFLSGYTSFLYEAARVNEQYFEAVVEGVSDDSEKEELSSLNSYYATVHKLGQNAESNLASGSTSADQLGSAMTYYLSSAALVSAQSAIGAVSTSGAGNVTASTPQVLESSIESSTSAVDSLAGSVAADGVDPSFALWVKQAGVDLTSVPAKDQRANEAITGLTYVWLSALQLRMLASWGSAEQD